MSEYFRAGTFRRFADLRQCRLLRGHHPGGQSDFPKAKAILVVGSGINDIDASGEEKIREVAKRLQKVGVKLMFSGLKHQVRRLLEHGGVVEQLGRDAFFPDKETALRTLLQRYGDAADRELDNATPVTRG